MTAAAVTVDRFDFKLAEVGLATQGWCTIPAILCEATRKSSARSRSGEPSPKVLREIYLGLPARLIEAVLGPAVLSQLLIEEVQEWTRGDDAPRRDGAPVDFVAGFDVLYTDGDASVEIEVVSGSHRLDGPTDDQPTLRLALSPDDIAVLDSTLVRRRREGGGRVVRFSVVRSWMAPVRDFSESCSNDAPSRLRFFLGATSKPAADAIDWLHRAHGRAGL